MKIRDIINAATPGPWVWYEGGYRRSMALVKADGKKLQMADVVLSADGGWASVEVSESDAEYIAMANPTHWKLMEDALQRIIQFVDSESWTCDELDALLDYRKERGLDG